MENKVAATMHGSGSSMLWYWCLAQRKWNNDEDYLKIIQLHLKSTAGWLPQSPDASPTENVWDVHKSWVYAENKI